MYTTSSPSKCHIWHGCQFTRSLSMFFLWFIVICLYFFSGIVGNQLIMHMLWKQRIVWEHLIQWFGLIFSLSIWQLFSSEGNGSLRWSIISSVESQGPYLFLNFFFICMNIFGMLPQAIPAPKSQSSFIRDSAEEATSFISKLIWMISCVMSQAVSGPKMKVLHCSFLDLWCLNPSLVLKAYSF